MRKIIILSLVFMATLFAKTETLELTGEYSKMLSNQFKEALNIAKVGSINIYSETKDVVLKVDSNINSNSSYGIRTEHPDAIVLKNKTVEAAVENYYKEDYVVNHSKENAVIVNIESGTVSLNYSNSDDKNGLHSLMGVEVTLVVSITINGKEVKKETKLDHKLGKAVRYKNFLTSDDFDYTKLTVLGTTAEILENIINKDLKWNILNI